MKVLEEEIRFCELRSGSSALDMNKKIDNRGTKLHKKIKDQTKSSIEEMKR